MPAVRSALAARGGLELKRELDQSGRIAIEVDGETAHLLPEEVEVRLEERPGVAVHGDSELLVALDVELDDELIAEGLAREVVHRVQTGGALPISTTPTASRSATAPPKTWKRRSTRTATGSAARRSP